MALRFVDSPSVPTAKAVAFTMTSGGEAAKAVASVAADVSSLRLVT
jgi:hypothetical protein